ncbi:LytR/AlgR family response regulator transcription factor [Flagellimonas myxillae]|uniref:LytR/AlgR family response regulator transcription factor n=1 Tax=Flagellimonas myxillae TaxID=2942214 RepID=UPI00201EA586|nr:response regulator [Muricauda myxillae]MCL6266337.1 response regulator [Muricauda myxillae]
MELKCIIVDDEPRAIEVMKEYVEQISTLSLVNTFRNPLKAFDFIKQHEVDLVFLDINMPHLSGIQFIKSLSNKPFVVLTTAYSEYAVESYQLDVVDYLLKPIEFERFIICMNKVYDKIKQRNASYSSSGSDNESKPIPKEYIFVKNGTKIDRIDFNDILYIEGSGNYVSYQLKGRKIMSLGKMSEVIKLLPQDRFARIHKSHIVQINQINVIENNRVHIGDVQLSISQTYKAAFYHLIDS